MPAPIAVRRPVLTALILLCACPAVTAQTNEPQTDLSGLKMCGGHRLEAEISDPAKRDDAELIEAFSDVLSHRVSRLGNWQADVEITEAGHFRIEIPLQEDIEQVKTWLATTGDIAFYRVLGDEEANPASDETSLTLPALQSPIEDYRLDPAPILTGQDIGSADVTWTGSNQPAVVLSLDEKGTRLLADFTASHIGEQLAIAVNDEIVSAPVITGAIEKGRLMITGLPALADARDLAADLDAGTLPAGIDYLSTETFERPEGVAGKMCDLTR